MKLLSLILMLLALPFAALADEKPDYLKERLELAASPEYQPYPLIALHMGLMNEHYKRGADPKFSISEVNEPLERLSKLYPLGVQVNYTIANFLEYVVELSDDKKQVEGLPEIAQKKREKADAILKTILDSGDGNSPATAYQVINILEENAVLDQLQLTKKGQALLETDAGVYDEIIAIDSEENEHKVYFDISLFIDKK